MSKSSHSHSQRTRKGSKSYKRQFCIWKKSCRKPFVLRKSWSPRLKKLSNTTLPRYKIRAISRLKSKNYLRQIFRLLNPAVSFCKCKTKTIKKIGRKPVSQITLICFPWRARPFKDLNSNQNERSMSLHKDTSLLMIGNKHNFSNNSARIPSTCSVHATGRPQCLRLTLATYIWRTIRSKWLEINSTITTHQVRSRASFQVVLTLWCLALVLWAAHHQLRVASRLFTLKPLCQVKFREALL